MYYSLVSLGNKRETPIQEALEYSQGLSSLILRPQAKSLHYSTAPAAELCLAQDSKSHLPDKA